jgi:hypothetical protein
MPLLDAYQIAELLELAQAHRYCEDCGKFTAMDYCRTCDDFYWLHLPGCGKHRNEHYGHRLTVVPSVEER